MKFTKPDKRTIDRMTPRSIKALLDTLKSQRAELVKPYDLQIWYYEKLLALKNGDIDQETFDEFVLSRGLGGDNA